MPTTRLNDEAMASFLATLLPQIRSTPIGGTLLLPLNLAHSDVNNPTAAPEAEAVIIAAQRRTASPGRFSLAMIAGGAALKYHATSVGEHTAAFEHHAALVLEHVPEQRLGDSAWWYLLFRAQLHSAPGPAHMPETRAEEVREAAKAAASIATKATKAAASYLKHELQSAAHSAKERYRQHKGGGGGGDEHSPATPQPEVEKRTRDGARFLYETLLPFLNCRALLANATPSTVDWAPLPIGGHRVAPCHVATEAVRFVMRGTSGLSSSHASQLLVLLRWTLLRTADAELKARTTMSPSDDALLRASCRHLAALATELAAPLPPMLLRAILATFKSITSRLDTLAATAATASRAHSMRAPLVLPTSASAPSGACFPFVGRLRRDTPVDHLAGETRPTPIRIPCELTVVPQTVETYDAAASALRKCDEVCMLLANQQALLRNAVHLRLALLQHTLIELLPLPNPTPTCFWQREPMRRETQQMMLTHLHRLSRALLAASLALPNTPTLDASRLITMAAIVCLVDALLNARVEHEPTLFTLHYTGRADGPIHPFGFHVRPPSPPYRPVAGSRSRSSWLLWLVAPMLPTLPAHPGVARSTPCSADGILPGRVRLDAPPLPGPRTRPPAAPLLHGRAPLHATKRPCPLPLRLVDARRPR